MGLDSEFNCRVGFLSLTGISAIHQQVHRAPWGTATLAILGDGTETGPTLCFRPYREATTLCYDSPSLSGVWMPLWRQRRLAHFSASKSKARGGMYVPALRGTPGLRFVGGLCAEAAASALVSCAGMNRGQQDGRDVTASPAHHRMLSLRGVGVPGSPAGFEPDT